MLVDKKQRQIERHDEQIDTIQNKNVAYIVVDDLSDNARNIANDNGKDKYDAFSFGRFRL